MTIQKVANLKEFFRDALHDALSHQHVAVEGETEHYVVNMLTLFADADALYERVPGQRRARPAQTARADARRGARGADRRRRASAGCSGSATCRCSCPDSSRPASRASWSTSTITSRWAAVPTARSPRPVPPTRGRTLRQVFAELAAKFVPMVDALNEISESAYQHSAQDRLRLYEQWVKTGSERSRQLLRKLGVEPVPAARSRCAQLMSVGTLAALQGALAEIYDLPVDATTSPSTC